MPHLPPQVRASWSKQRLEDGLDSYRRWGFTGPDGDGRLYAVILNVQLSAGWGQLDSVELVAQRTGVRHMYEPGGDTHWGPRNLDDLDVRALLLDVLRGEVRAPQAREALNRHFDVDPLERDERAMEALRRGGGTNWLTLGGHLIAHGADYQMAEAAAAESKTESVVAALARSHPATHVRCAAIANRTLGSGALACLAADRDGVIGLALLNREDLPAEATTQVVESLLLSGALDHHAMHVALCRPDFPDHLLETAVMRIAGDGTAARIDLARQMHAAPPHRRDEVHLQLLRGARRIKSTADLVDAVVGPDADRASWLADQSDWKLQSLMAWRGELRGGDGPGNAGAAEESGANSPVVPPPASFEPSTPTPLVELRRPPSRHAFVGGGSIGDARPRTLGQRPR